MLQACKFHMRQEINRQENTFKSGFLMKTLFFCSIPILKCRSIQIVLHKTSSTNSMNFGIALYDCKLDLGRGAVHTDSEVFVLR